MAIMGRMKSYKLYLEITPAMVDTSIKRIFLNNHNKEIVFFNFGTLER